MKIGKAYIRDSYGWPVELFKDRPITNFIRLLIHGSINKTWSLRKREKPEPWDLKSSGDVQTFDEQRMRHTRVMLPRGITSHQEINYPNLDDLNPAERAALEAKIACRMDTAFEEAERVGREELLARARQDASEVQIEFNNRTKD